MAKRTNDGVVVRRTDGNHDSESMLRREITTALVRDRLGRTAALASVILVGLVAMISSGVVIAQEGEESGLQGRIVARAQLDDDANLARVEFGFRPAWGESDGADDILPRSRILSARLIFSRAGTWLRSSEFLIPDAAGSETGARGRIIARSQVDDDGNFVRVEFGFRPAWGESDGADDILPRSRILSAALIQDRAGRWLRSSAITVPVAAPSDDTSDADLGVVGEEGGQVSAADGATLIVPAGAAQVGTTITARALDEDEYADLLPEGVNEVAGVWDFTADADFEAPVMIRVPLPDDATRPWFLGHRIDGEWYAEPVTIEDDFVVAEVESLSDFSLIWGIPVLGPVVAGCDLLGGKCSRKIERVIDQTLDKLWEGVQWTVDWAAEVTGLRDPVVCNNPDTTVTVDNPPSGGLVDRLIGVYLKGCAQATAHDGSLLVVRNPRHIWFDVRPIRGQAVHAQGNEAFSWMSDHAEGTLLGPGATADWRATQGGVVVLNADFSWTAAGLTALYPAFTALLGKIVPTSALGEVAATAVKRLIDSAAELQEALNQFRRGNGEAALKTLAETLGGSTMREAIIDALVAAGRQVNLAGVLTRTAVGAAFGKLELALKIAGYVRSGAEALKVLVRNDEDRFGTVTFTVPEPDCWGDDLEIGTTSLYLGGICQSQRRIGRNALYYRLVVPQAGTVTVDLTSSRIDGFLYLSGGESRSGQPLAFDDNGGEGMNARIERELEPGVYTVEVTTAGQVLRQGGRFSLAVSQAATAATSEDAANGGADENGAAQGGAGQGDTATEEGAPTGGGAQGATADSGAAQGSAADGGSQLMIDAGGNHTCAVRENGTLICWGNNGDGQSDYPAGSFPSVSAGSNHTCAVRENGALVCWGNNRQGQTDAPEGSFRSVSAGSNHTCAVRENGALVCWGDNHDGQTDAPEGSFRSVSASRRHTCAVRESDADDIALWPDVGFVVCWGDNRFGKTSAPDGRFRSVSAGGGFSHLADGRTCAVRQRGQIVCWGYYNGRFAAHAPQGSFRSVSAGNDHACAVRENGTLTCWGSNDEGQSDAPGGSFRSVSAGSNHTCAVRDDGIVVCWGGNDDRGQTDVPAVLSSE